MIKACIFDLDGTLLDTLTQISYYLNTTLKGHGMDEIDLPTVRNFVGNGGHNLVTRALTHVGREDMLKPELFNAFFKEYLDFYNSGVDYLVEPYEGIHEALRALSAAGVRLAVRSNKPHSTVVPVVEKFFPGIFEVVQGAEDSIPIKPDPKSCASVLASLGLPAEQTAFIGDSEVDMETAKNYGAGLAVGVSWGFRDRAVLESSGADIILDAAKLIPEAIARANGGKT